MASSQAATVAEYLAELPPTRREAIAAVRDLVRRHIPQGYRETMAWGMICWEVPLERYPDTYNGKPLAFAALAAQKSYNALYLMCAYVDPAEAEALRDAAARMGVDLDMGKCCLRFGSPAALPQAAIGTLIASMPVERFLARHEASRAPAGGKAASRRPAGKRGGAGAAAEPAPARRSGARKTAVAKAAAKTAQARRKGR